MRVRASGQSRVNLICIQNECVFRQQTMVCAVILISRQIAIWIRGLPPTDHFRSVRSTSRDSARDSIVDAAASKSFTETFG